MPRKKVPRPCCCGCGKETKGGKFCPGHDSKLLSAIVEHVGGIMELRDAVEGFTKRPVSNPNEQLPKICPECGHNFQGHGWGGIDAHWRAHHEDVMAYEIAWPLIRAGEYNARP